MNQPSTLWKLTIAPQGKTDPTADAFAFCRSNRIVGVGWPFTTVPASWREVETVYRRDYPKARFAAALRIIGERAKIGDHVWVYGKRQYYVCRLESDWEYRAGVDWDRHDMHNIRSASWQPVSQELVPGLVRRKMTMYGAGQVISEDSAWCRVSHALFSGSADMQNLRVQSDPARLEQVLAAKSPAQLFALLDADECEDIVCCMLQDEGWRVLKSSAYRSQRDTECILRRLNGTRPETGYVQVKSGRNATLDPMDFRHLVMDEGTVYLFSTATPPYSSEAPPNVKLIEQEAVASFLVTHLHLFTPATLLKLALWSTTPDADGA